MGEATPTQVRRLAMDYLARREHGHAELISKLKQRGVDNDMALDVVDKLAVEGLQDDQRFGEMYTRAQAARGKGPMYISNALQQRGLSDTEADRSVTKAEVDWAQSAVQVALKKYGVGPCDYEAKAGRMRFLLQRGFTPEQASYALREIESGLSESHPF